MKYGYYEEGTLIKPINYFIVGAHILVVCSPTDYSLKMINLENVGWELRDCIKVLLKDKTLQVGLLRKPFKGTVANNVLTNGCGGLNIDACRIGQFTNTTPSGMVRWNDYRHGDNKYPTGESVNVKEGRFPANIILDAEAGAMLDEQSGESKAVKSNRGIGFNDSGVFGDGDSDFDTQRGFDDSGGASRFFFNFETEKQLKEYLINLIKV
jgi:hypothetical protein